MKAPTLKRMQTHSPSNSRTNWLPNFCLRSFFAAESAFLAVLFSFSLLSEFQRVEGSRIRGVAAHLHDYHGEPNPARQSKSIPAWR